MITIGEAPAWVAGLTDDDLRDRFGDSTFERGLDYARHGAVHDVQISGRGRIVTAQVNGSRRTPYQTLVTSPALDGTDIGGRCTCPVSTDCKHVVAMLLAIRGGTGRVDADEVGPDAEDASEHVDPPPAWANLLDNLVGSTRTTASDNLALEFEIVQTYNSSGPRVRLRALVRGKNGRWIKTGATWRELESPYRAPGQTPITPDQRSWAIETLAIARSRIKGYYSSYSEVVLHLDDLGPAAWRLIADANASASP